MLFKMVHFLRQFLVTVVEQALVAFKPFRIQFGCYAGPSPCVSNERTGFGIVEGILFFFQNQKRNQNRKAS